ncbi:hypothetical protein DESA109040_22760 [Deinococcus saxicola]
MSCIRETVQALSVVPGQQAISAHPAVAGERQQVRKGASFCQERKELRSTTLNGTCADFEELPEVGGVMLKRLTEGVGFHNTYCKRFNRSPYQTLFAQRRQWFRRHLNVVADGQYAKVMFMDAVFDEGYAFVTKLQSNANLLYPFTGPHPKRRGAWQKWAGKVDFVNFTGWTSVTGKARARVWTQVVWGPHFQRFFRVVVIEDLDRRGAVRAHVVLCSTDTTMPAEQIRALYSSRFRLEFVFRDAKQFAGLTTCQFRSTPGFENHWNASFFALSLGRAEVLLEAAGLQGRPATSLVFSYEDIKRRGFNRLFAWRILSNLGLQARFVELEQHSSRPLDLGVKAA